MVLTEERIPYELLFRWNTEGILSGAHVGFRSCVKKDDVVIADTLEHVMSVAVAGNEGFPLEEVLAQVTIDALAVKDALEAERDGLIIERDAEKQRANLLAAELVKQTAESGD